MNSPNQVYNYVNERIIKLLEDGTIPWKKPWLSHNTPKNLITKRAYRGINIWLLAANKYSSPYYATWNQVMKAGGKIKKDEAKNYHFITFWKVDKHTEKNKAGEDVEKTHLILRYFNVYNLEQMEFSPEKLAKLVPAETKLEFNPIEKCEEIVSGYKTCPEIKFGGDRAYYNPLFDRIQMPNKDTFESVEKFYATEFHEMAHSTGAEKRLARFKQTDTGLFGSENYSKEELVAEMTSSYLCAEAGIENLTLENSAAYIKGWLENIKKGDNTFIVSAASKSQAASDYILNRGYNKEEETTEETK